jgi:uncharacterized protein YjbI with pentapeptide repeats
MDMSPRIDQNALQKKLVSHLQFLRGVQGGQRLILKLHDAADLIFAKRNLSWAEMVGSDLSRCIFLNSSMVGISLFGANLEGADLRGADLYRSDLRGINLRKANLEAANLAEADIRDGRLFVQSENGSYEPVGDGVSRIDDAVLARANLQSARLGNAIGPRTDLSGANLRHANLVNANLSESDLSGVDFSGANLSGANLGGCVLHGAVLLGATMDGTNFSDADLTASLFMKSEMDPDQLRDAVVAPSLAEVGGTIADILREHSVWVRSLGSEGSQADMSGIDLTGLSLRGVDTKTLRSRLILMFPCRAISESIAMNRSGRSPWVLRLLCGKILLLRIYVNWPNRARTRLRAAACSPWRRFMPVAGAQTRPRLVRPIFRSSVIGFCVSMQMVRQV